MVQQIKYYSLSIFLGGGCNLDCSYCFVDKENLEKVSPNVPELKRGISFFLKHSAKEPTINFTGGEPLLYWKELKELIEYLRRNEKKKVFIVLSSNGTLLNKERSEFLTKNNVGLSISLDGKQNINDAKRIFKNDKKRSVFTTVWKNIKNLDKEKIKISLVFTPQTVSRLTENIKFFVGNGFRLMDFYPEVYGLWSKNQLNVLKKSFHEFSKFFKSTPGIKISFMTKGLEKNSENFCCQKLNLGPDGNFYLCDKVFSFFDKRRKKYIVGRGEKGIDKAKRENLLRKAKKEILNQKYCFCPIGLYLKHVLPEASLDLVRTKKFLKNISRPSVKSQKFIAD